MVGESKISGVHTSKGPGDSGLSNRIVDDLDGCSLALAAGPADALAAKSVADAHGESGSTWADCLTSPPGRACFLIVGQGALRTAELTDKGEHVVGSDPAVDIHLADPAVARRHAVLKCRPDGRLTILPVNDDCPVLVNLRFVEGPVVLADGDIVSIGSMTLTFHDASRSLRRDVPGMAAFHERLEYRIEDCRAAEDRMVVVSLCLAMSRGGELGRRIFEDLMTVLDDDDLLLGTDGVAQLFVACRFSVTAPEAICERLCVDIGKFVPVQTVGFAVFPDVAKDAGALLAVARCAMRPVVQPDAPQARPVVQTMQVAGHSIHVLDPAMRRLFDSVRSLSATDLPVLIQGETGVGKELVAHALHEWSSRRDKRLVTINCAAIADTLVENELFGHEPGAFTGAGPAKPGLLESAEGGTVFLDEIGECSPKTQAKLLRVLETRRVCRLGSVKERHIDVRWVAATNRDLKVEVAEHRFRSDLLFRLNTASVHVSPLRSRLVEIPILARTFLESACVRSGRPVPALSLAATRCLIEYRWPGNVRELRGLMEFLAATSDGPEIRSQQLPPEILAGAWASGQTKLSEMPVVHAGAMSAEVTDWAGYSGLYEEVRLLEERRIKDALKATGGVRVDAARLLDMPLRTFHSKMKTLEIKG